MRHPAGLLRDAFRPLPNYEDDGDRWLRIILARLVVLVAVIAVAYFAFIAYAIVRLT